MARDDAAMSAGFPSCIAVNCNEEKHRVILPGKLSAKRRDHLRLGSEEFAGKGNHPSNDDFGHKEQLKGTGQKQVNKMLGLPGDVARICPYTSEWRQAFVEERERLLACIGDYVLGIHHVVSTSILGMSAKPILDIAIAVTDFPEAARCVQPLEQLGYAYRGEYGIPRRHYFVKGHPRTHHVHMVEIQCEDWAAILSFRDHLRRHPDVAEAYASLKRGWPSSFRPTYWPIKMGRRSSFGKSCERRRTIVSSVLHSS